MPQYEGKPTAYLDQNILDIIVKHGFIDFANVLKSKFQVIYSDETLKEIRRSGKYAEQFLDVLKKLNAFHLKIVLEQSGFIITDQAMLTDRDPFEVFNEYCQNQYEHDNVQKPMEQWLYKLSGGRVGEGISEILNEQKNAFSEQISRLNAQAVEVSEDIPGIEYILKDYGESMKAQLEALLKETERLMKENITDDKNWSGIKDFREAVGIGPKELNNVETPNVLRKIWEKYRKVPPYDNMNIDIEDFFGLTQNPIYPNQPYFKHQKVTAIYNMLNTLGYYPDSKVHKERRFIASLSDTSHGSLASFCNVLFSRDEYFIKKVRAVYEFLEIPTVIQRVVLKNA